MSLVVNHNLMAMNAARNLTTIFGRLGRSVERLSSGLRVNSAADDAAGLAIRELMRADIAVINQGIRNASDALSMIQTAEGGMSVIDEKLIRMKELAEQAATGTYTTAQREIMNSEYQAMAAEIDRIANATDFNGVKLLDGSLGTAHNGSGMKIHFGTGNDAAEDYYFIDIGDMRATASTGLRIGNSDTRDIFTTTGLDLTTPNDLIAGSGGTTTGVFGIQTTTDGGTTWKTYGWVTVDATDTLADIAAEINRGPQYTTTLTVASGVGSNVLDGKTLTINGNVFTFDSGTAATASTANTIGLDGLSNSASGLGGATLATQIARVINDQVTNGDSGVNALATVSGATITLYHEDFGEPTGTTSLGLGGFGSGSSSLSLGSSWTARNVGNNVTAKAALDSSSYYELQLQGSLTGNNNQIRIVLPNGATIDDAGSGTTLTAGTSLLIGHNPATVTVLASMDEADEWEQSQNATGTTSWDGADILTQSAAQLALAAVADAIQRKDISRANLGAVANRLDNTINVLRIQAENLQASESRISDVDVAMEMTEYTRNNILSQAAVAMLAQANSLPNLALNLLGG